MEKLYGENGGRAEIKYRISDQSTPGKVLCPDLELQQRTRVSGYLSMQNGCQWQAFCIKESEEV